MSPMAQWVGQQGFEAVGTGSNPSFYILFNLNITTENRNTSPPPCMKSFDTRNILKPGKVPLRNFSVL